MHELPDSFTRDVRVGFVRKVLGIVSFQLLFTLSMVIYSGSTPSFEAFIKNPLILAFGIILSLVPSMSLLCCNLTRIVPINYIMLFLFTLGESIMVTYITSMYTFESVIFAVILFCITTVCLWFASLCMNDINQYAPIMIGSLCFALFFQLAAIPICLMGSNYDTYLMMEGVGGSLIYGIYVVIDLKMI